MTTLSSIKPTTRLALGRAHELGEIFDAREDKFTGIQAFSLGYEKHFNEIDCGGNEYFFVTEETLENKLEKMNLEAELKMSFIAGLVKVEGSGKYLNETNSSSERISYSVIFKIRTKRQILKIYNRSLRNEDNFPTDLIDPNIGTHIINGVTWGAQIIATFSMDINKVKSDFKLEGNLRAFVKTAALEISGKASFSNQENSDLYRKNISVSIIGDIMPIGQDSLITDLDGFKSFLKNVPGMLKKTNRGLGVPLEYNLFPLNMLFDQNKLLANKILNDISEEFLRKSLKTMDLIKTIQNQINFLIDECYRYEAIFSREIKELVEIKDIFESDTIHFKTKLKTQVILFRSAEDPKNFSGLEELFLEYSKSEWYPEKVRQKIFDTKIYCERKIKFFDRFQKKNCKILCPYSSYDEAYLDDEKFKIFFLYTSMKFLQDGDDGIMVESQETIKIHGRFFDLCKDEVLSKESFFFIFDYDSIPKVYERHGSPNRPKIIYECKRQRITNDFYSMESHFERIKNYMSWDEEEEDFKRVDHDFTKEKNDFFNASRKSDQLNIGEGYEKNNKLLPVLVTGHNLARDEKEDNLELDCLMQLKKSEKPKKVFIVEQEKFNNIEIIRKLNKMSILLYYENNILTTDYLADRGFIPSIIELLEQGIELIHSNDLNKYRYEDKLIFFYSRQFYNSQPTVFNQNYKKIKELLEQKKEKHKLLSDYSTSDIRRKIVTESKYYLFNCDEINIENKEKIKNYFGFKDEILDSCIVLSYEDKILSVDYLNDSKDRDKLAGMIDYNNIDTFKPKKFQLKGHSSKVYSLIKMNEKQIVSVSGSYSKRFLDSDSGDNSIRVWDIESQECIKVIENAHNDSIRKVIKFSNKSILTGSGDNKIKLFDIESGQCLRELSEHSNCVHSLCLINENSFASCSEDQTVKIWDFNNNSTNSVRTLNHETGVYSVIMMKDHELISGIYRGRIISWDIRSGQRLNIFGGHSETVWSLIKVSEKLFASGSYDKSIRIWDYESKSCIRNLVGHSSCVDSLLRIDDKTIASGSGDHTIKIWDVGSNDCLLTLKGHSNSVRTLEKMNEHNLISGSYDNSIIIWRNFRKFKQT